jgi:hypothetical protein
VRDQLTGRVVRDQLTGQGHAVDRFSGIALTVTDDDFGTVIVQLPALGLITRTERNEVSRIEVPTGR